MMHLWMLTVLPLLLSGCINIDPQLQPVNPSVKAVIQGRDCVPIFLSLGFGTNTVEYGPGDRGAREACRSAAGDGAG